MSNKQNDNYYEALEEQTMEWANDRLEIVKCLDAINKELDKIEKLTNYDLINPTKVDGINMSNEVGQN